MIKIIIAILVFGLIITIHEFGHFIVAKKNDIKVNKFAIGMGPALFKFQKGETEYSLRIFPIGGYCSMEGEDQGSSDNRAFNNKPVLRRMAVIVAGAIMNLLLGLVLIIISTSLTQGDLNTNTIAGFKDNATSLGCGLQAGDKLLKINGMRIFTDNDVSYKLGTNKDDNFDVVVRRNGEKVTLDNVQFNHHYYYRYVKMDEKSQYAPYFKKDNATGEYTKINESEVGIDNYYYYHDSAKNEYIVVQFVTDDKHDSSLQKAENRFDFYVQDENKSVGSVLSYSLRRTVTVGQLVWTSLFDLVTGKYGMKDMSGPVGIVSVIGNAIDPAAKAIQNVLMILDITIFITINVGIFNLLPLPALDGGRLVFLIVEAIRRKPVKPEHEGFVHLIGMALLIGLMILLTFNDIKKLIM